MKKLLAIIPAAVLGIGAATAGVFANAATANKASVSVDYMSAFSKDSERIDEKNNSSAVSYQADAQNNFIDDNNDGICDNYTNGTGNGYCHGNGNFTDNNGICDNYADGTCPRNGTGSGYCHGNGGGHRRRGL